MLVAGQPLNIALYLYIYLSYIYAIILKLYLSIRNSKCQGIILFWMADDDDMMT
jgi:hypothetical protein